VVTTALLPGAAPARTALPRSPEAAIFYYAWYGTPTRDGSWQHWPQGGNAPPDRIGAAYFPARGPYSSLDPHVLAAQMREIAAARIGTLIVSWWGPGSVEDARLRPVAAAAKLARLRVAVHIEPYEGRTPESTAMAIRMLAQLGIRDFYVYDSVLDDDVAWQRALGSLDRVRVFANTGLPGKARRGGFQGLYTYDVLIYDGSSFPRMCAAARRLRLLCAPSVGPGFDAYRATGLTSTRARLDGRWYDHMWRSALRAAPDIVTITSYNEWHEGTQIEPAQATEGLYASYDGAYGVTGRRAERAYLDRTRYWVSQLRPG